MTYTGPKTWVTGETIDASELNALEVAVQDVHVRVIDVRDYGVATGNTAAANKTAIDSVLTIAAAVGGATVYFPAGTYSTTGAHTLPPDTIIAGSGLGPTVLNHTSANVCITHTDPRYTHSHRAGLRDIRIVDANHTATGGVRIYDCYGFFLNHVSIMDYQIGYGLLLENVANWTEGTYLADCALYNNLTGIGFLRSSAGASTSFGYTKFHNFTVSAGIASAVGIDMGMTGVGTGSGSLYNSEVFGNIWLNANNTTAVRVRAGFTAHRNHYFIRGEKAGVTGTVGLNIEGAFSGFGIALIDTVANTVTGTNEMIGVQSVQGSSYNAIRLRGGALVQDGVGTPEGATTAPVGSLYLRTNGGAGTTLYIKESGTGNTGWIAK